MPGKPVSFGPFTGGLHNSALSGAFIQDDELFDIVNLEVDTDGSLVNRPAISEFDYTVPGSKSGARVLGVFMPSDGRRFLVVMNAGSLRLVDLSTGTTTLSSSTAGLTHACVVQYKNRLYVSPGPTDTSGNGGYFEALPSTTPTWTTVAAVPSGGAIFLYKERLFSVAGVDATTNISRLKWSNVGDGSTWGGTAFVDVYDSNGEKLVDGIVLNNDIILFKQHSTYRFTYDTDVTRAQLVQISSNIGVPAAQCAAVYDNSNVYLIHGNAVYEMYNFNFQRISDKVDMTQNADATLFSDMNYGLSIHRDRLFVRYYTNFYCYALRTGTWSRWTTARKFSKFVVVPSTAAGLDIAYAAAATTDNDGKIFYFKDSRVLDVGVNESYMCSIVTKTYDLGMPYLFKRLFYWGLTIATLGNATITAVIPNSGKGMTWDELGAYTWDQATTNGFTWDSAPDIVHTYVIAPSKGEYARKFYKLARGVGRFLRVYFTTETAALPNTVEESCVRIFDYTLFVRQGEGVKERVS